MKGDATPDQVRTRYYKRLAALHPNSRLGESSADKFIALTHAYKQYLVVTNGAIAGAPRTLQTDYA